MYLIDYIAHGSKFLHKIKNFHKSVQNPQSFIVTPDGCPPALALTQVLNQMAEEKAAREREIARLKAEKHTEEQYLIQNLIEDTHDRMDAAATQMIADAEAAGIAPANVEKLGSIAWTPPRKRKAQEDAQGSSPGAASSTSPGYVAPGAGSASNSVAATGSTQGVTQFPLPEEPFWDDIQPDAPNVACPSCSKLNAKWRLWRIKKPTG